MYNLESLKILKFHLIGKLANSEEKSGKVLWFYDTLVSEAIGLSIGFSLRQTLQSKEPQCFIKLLPL